MENSVWETVLAILASFGGAGVIILGVGKWLANLAAERILKKTEFEFSQKLEALKSNLERKNYISKTRFDLEIEVYRQLSEATILMVMSNSDLFPYVLKNVQPEIDLGKELKQKNHESAVDNYNAANLAITRNAPFIPQEIYDDFDEIRKACRSQISFFFLGVEKFLGLEVPEELKKEREKCFERTLDINNKLNVLLEKLRKHIASLDVLDR